MTIIKKQSGFTAVEIVLVVALIAALGVVGYYAVSAHNKHNVAVTSSVSPQTPQSNTTLYNGSDFSFQYPKNWTLDQPLGQGGATSLTLVGSPLNLAPMASKNGMSNIVVEEFAAGSDYLKTFNDASDFPVTPTQTAVTINGNSGYYSVEKTSYATVLAYVIDHGAHAVQMTFELSATGTSSNPAVDNTQYQAVFDAVARSLTFK